MKASAKWCFTAWNDPIGTPNCMRSFRIGDRHVEHALPESDQLGGGAQRGAVEHRPCHEHPVTGDGDRWLLAVTTSTVAHGSIARVGSKYRSPTITTSASSA